jgi:hypothetical protein
MFNLDYTLVFPKSRFRQVIDSLRPLCSSDTESALAGLLNPAPTEVVVAIRALPDMPAAVVKEFPKTTSCDRKLGPIKISRSRSPYRPGNAFRICPSTPQLQHAIFSSRQFRKKIIHILETCDGHSGYVVVEECDPTGFWHRSNEQYREANLEWCLGSWYSDENSE